MLYGIGLSGTGAQIERSRLENLSNNLANLETAGFKEDLLTVMQRPAESRTWLTEDDIERAFWADDLLDRTGGGVWLNQSHTSFEPGQPIFTGHDYDFALTGEGFFKLAETHSGKQRFSRAGKFDVNPVNGHIQTPDGKYTLLDRNNQPINATGLIESNGGQGLLVSEKGEIAVKVGSTTVDTGIVLGVTVFAEKDLNKLVKLGDNMFDVSSYGIHNADQEPKPIQLMDIPVGDRRAVTAKVRQGAWEGSRSDPAKLMVEMIKITRAYEANMKTISAQDGTVSRLLSGVARV